jgi:hypothetical protein
MTLTENLTSSRRVRAQKAGTRAKVMSTVRAHSEGPGDSNSEALDAGPATP